METLDGTILPEPRLERSITNSSEGKNNVQSHENGEQANEMLRLSHTHAHAQWRTIAEEFSSLLDKDFVDIVLKVRGGYHLAAHKSLLAAVWPALREDLRPLKYPSSEYRATSLTWLTSGNLSPGPVASIDPPLPQSEPGSEEAPAAGVLDVSSRSWGSWGVVRALFCHLYSRPVAIQKDELELLRTAAATLGSLELARSCDDAVDHKPWHTSSRTKEGEGEVLRVNSSYETEVDRGIRTPQKRPSGTEILVDKVDDARGNEARARARHTMKPTGDPSLPHTDVVGGEARPRVRKPFGESSFFTEEGQKNVDEGTFGIRHVLSDLKRIMVESSRVISDKTFQSMYDVVTGEQGILGQGINGPVRLAINKRNGRHVAVKRISCVNLSEQRRQMLLSEVRIFLQVSHRNIVQLFEVYESESDQAVLLVMELCTGKELFERLAERKYYSEFDAARVTRQMLDAVSYLHSQNICHRDLKLENWLYENPSADAKLKLCDFGFGQIVEPTVKLTATLGSLYYVAPEVLEGSYGLPCDMWSMGVIVHMLLSGNPPFDGKTDTDTIQKIKLGRYNTSGKRWEGITETAKHFLYSVLRKDPSERLSASEAAQHAWLNMEDASKKRGVPNELSIDQGVIRDMWKLTQNTAISRAALSMLSNAGNNASFHGAEEDLTSLEEQFKRFDGQNTGKINVDEFTKVLKENKHLAATGATKVFERIAGSFSTAPPGGEQQTRRKREVDYSEFITLTKAKRVAYNSAAIREAFRVFDKEGEGFIKDGAIRVILAEDFKGDEEMVNGILAKCDVNGAGLIDYSDFASAFSEELANKEYKEFAANEHKRIVIEPEKPPEAASTTASVTETSPKNTSRQTSGLACPSAVELPPQDNDVTMMSSPRKAGGNEEQEDANDEDNLEPESDEEQLVVKESDTRALAPSDQQVEKETKAPPKTDKMKEKYNFSLSLAGSSEHDDVSTSINRVASLPSDVYLVRQMPLFHKEILKPFYGDRPVSNICMGLIRGTSLYAKQSAAARLATIIHTVSGWFFIMPNPKYHREINDRKGLLSKDAGKFRFVAWWIHPRFVPELRRWFERMTYEGKEHERQEKEYRARERANAVKAEKADNAEREGGRKRDFGDTEPGNRSDTADPGTRSGEDPPSPKGPPTMPPPTEKVKKDRPLSPTSAPLVNVGFSGGSDAEDPRAEKKPRVLEKKEGDSANLAANSTAANTGNPGNPGNPKDHGAKDFPMGMGGPGDFCFSDVPKPDNYLHTYRDLHTREHILMLTQLYEGVNRFLRTLFDDNFLASAQISAGFHYPVRPQYSTLHMQLRVNSGSVCRDDGRGLDIHSLIETLQGDRLRYHRDDEQVRYQVTENIKVSLLAAAKKYTEVHPEMEVVRQTAPLGYDLGIVQMPTIKDDDGQAEPDSETAKQETTGEYIINLQPAAGSPFCNFLYEKRSECAEQFGKDPSHLYPLHISVTGFFEATKAVLGPLVNMIQEVLTEELSELRGESAVLVKEPLSVNAGYVLWDIEAPAITGTSKTLSTRSKDLGLNIRSKAVNHISLAMGRPEAEMRRQIEDVYKTVSAEIKDGSSFELVLSRRIFRGSFDRFDVDGPHRFKEVARVPCTTLPGNIPTPAALLTPPFVPQVPLGPEV